IFQTHAHDDHFNGLPILLRSDHKLKYYSTALVRATVTKKLCSLMCIKEQSFGNYFEIHDLNLDTWNNIDGLEVMPVLSPHPLETTILFFRTLWNEGYMSYAHLADICSLELLEKAVTGDKLKNGVSRDFFNKVKTAYFTPADIKKIDIGGGMIHGNAADFAADGSKKIIFSHSSGPLTDEQKELGSSASFGLEDVLIRGEQDYLKPAAMGHFKSLYPSVPQHDLRMLLNCPAVSFNPGTIIIRKGEVNSDMYFILTGLLEFIVSETGIRNYLGSGSMAGELSGLLGTAARGTYRAISRVRAIKISSRMYHEFAVRNDLLSEIKQNVDKRNFLQNTWLFGEMISCPIKNKIAGVMKRTDFERNEVVDFKGASRLFLVESGHLELTADDNPVETIDSGNFFGVEIILFGTRKYFSVRAVEKSRTYAIPGSLIQDIPVVQWKLIETFKKRMRKAGYLASG
ncbi:MAG: cyclic nucleotide-binding domain-containing protein, partial [Spirochaetales bacterium]